MGQEPNYNYLDLLNPQQRAAVLYNEGPALVIAGAGSGKTRVLTYKIVNLISCGYEPYRIMALTFTNKAAREMKERITAILGDKVASKLWMGTFHSIFLRILRRHSEEIGFTPGFTIYDSADSKSLLKMIVKDLALDEKIYKPSVLASVISNAKNAMITPTEYLLDRDNYENDKKSKRPLIGQIYKIYQERCKLANAMDFDDILVYMNILMRDYPDVCRHYQEFFKYVLVDEYQDTNFSQHLIVSQLVGDRQNLCVVGDDAQSIYSFRGADINNILYLENRYPKLKIFKLERNYRSTQNIINAAESLIDKNMRQMKKHVYSENEPGELINVVRTYSDMEEAFMVANMINQSKLTHHDSYDEYAILYRTNAQSRILEDSLRKRNMPYRIYGGLSFYQRKEVKDMIAYFRLSVNPDDDEALRRIINYPTRGIGETTLKKLYSAASSETKSLWQVITSSDLKNIGLNSGIIAKLNSFKDLIQEFIDDNIYGSNAYALGQLIYNRTGILTLIAHDSTPESISKQENLKEILSGLKEFVDLREQTGGGETDMKTFLSEVMLATDQDENDTDDLPKISLMTVHSAKGLEFKHVYVVGVEEDLFPSSMSLDSFSQIEEERRLLYVAITRAKESCVLTYAGSRFRNGQTVMTSPSRFLGDIDRRFIHIQVSKNVSMDNSKFENPLLRYNTSRSGYASKPSRGLSKIPIPKNNSKNPTLNVIPQHTAQELSIGMSILHDRFGAGKIVKIDSLSGEDMITVDFGVIGIKNLLLKFVKFKIL